MIEVIKIGGQQLDDSIFLTELAELIGTCGRQLVIVHGGGQATTQLSQKLGLESRFIEGLRVTDAATLDAAVMGMVGTASSRVVSFLVQQGVAALGLSGLDAGIVRCRKQEVPAGMEFVGHPSRVDDKRLRALIQAGFVPCIAPICLSEDGTTQLYNVNADPVAGAVAAALGAKTLTMLTNVPGILHQGEAVEYTNPWQIDTWIEQGHISGGMIPKVRSAVEALNMGVDSVRICDLKGLQSLWGSQAAGAAHGTIIERVTIA
jgi:acetylglutamate kinase